MSEPSMSEPDSYFYLAVNHFKTEIQLMMKDAKLFKAQPMGVNSIMKDMTEAAEISVKTNHSGRETRAQKLQDCEVPTNQIVQIMGHKINQLTTTVLFERNKWRIFHKFYPWIQRPRTTRYQQKTSWQPRRCLFSTKSLHVRPLYLPWTLTPSKRTSFKRCFMETL